MRLPALHFWRDLFSGSRTVFYGVIAFYVVTGLTGCSRTAPSSPPATSLPAASAPAPSGLNGQTGDPTAKAATQLEETPFQLEPDFQLLSLADFQPFPADVTSWSESDQTLHCTGHPRGYLSSRESFRNFTWRLEYRFPRPATLKNDSQFKGNTGFMVFVTGEPKIWPLSLEVQGKFSQMGTIKENGGAEAPVVTDQAEARLEARKAVGEWNALEITSREGALAVTLNGVSVASSEPNFLSEGAIGIQAEDHPFEVRRMRIRRDLSAP